MKNILVVLATLLSLLTSAMAFGQQRLIYNDKAPALAIKEVVKGAKPQKGKALLVDFLVLNNDQSAMQLQALDALAQKYSDLADFAAISNDEMSTLKEYFGGKAIKYSVLLDDAGKSFSLYDVKYVPKAVLLDAKGNFVWTGKTSQLTDDLLLQYIR